MTQKTEKSEWYKVTYRLDLRELQKSRDEYQSEDLSTPRSLTLKGEELENGKTGKEHFKEKIASLAKPRITKEKVQIEEIKLV